MRTFLDAMDGWYRSRPWWAHLRQGMVFCASSFVFILFIDGWDDFSRHSWRYWVFVAAFALLLYILIETLWWRREQRDDDEPTE